MIETFYNEKEWMKAVLMPKTKEIITNKTVGALLKTLVWHQDGKKTWEESIMVNYQLNIKQAGEGLELLSQLENRSASLIFLDPQYEAVSKVLHLAYPLSAQSDYQILRMMEQVSRVLKPSSFCLLCVNKTLLGND